MFNKIVKSKSLIYLIGELTSKLSPFLALPLLTRVLTPDEFAIYSLFVVSVFFAYILSSLATASYIPIVFFKDKNELSKTISTIISVSNVMGATAFVVAIVFLKVNSGFDNYLYCILGAISVGYFSVFFQIKLTLYQCNKKAVQYIVLNIARNIIFLVLVCIGYISGFSNSEYFIFSYAASYFFILPFVLISIIKDFGVMIFRLNFDRSVINFGLPSIPNALANWAKTSVDRYIILFSLGTVQLGLYSAAYQLAFGTMVISSALVKAMSPNLFSSLKDSGYDEKVKIYCFKYLVAYILISLCYCLMIYLFSGYLLGEEYLSVGLYSSLLVFSAIFQGAASFFIGVLFFNNKVSQSLYYNVMSLLIHILLLVVVASQSAPIEYYIGAAILSSFIYFILIVRGANVYYCKSH